MKLPPHRIVLSKTHSAKVKTVAKKKGVTLPAEPDAKPKAMAGKPGKESGGAFDKVYMEHARVMDHKIVLSTLKSDTMKIKDPDVKALAEAHSQVAEQHLKSAGHMTM